MGSILHCCSEKKPSDLHFCRREVHQVILWRHHLKIIRAHIHHQKAAPSGAQSVLDVQLSIYQSDDIGWYHAALKILILRCFFPFFPGDCLDVGMWGARTCTLIRLWIKTTFKFNLSDVYSAHTIVAYDCYNSLIFGQQHDMRWGDPRNPNRYTLLCILFTTRIMFSYLHMYIYNICILVNIFCTKTNDIPEFGPISWSFDFITDRHALGQTA